MIAWAIDPFAKDQSLNEKSAELIGLLLRAGFRGTSVQPMTVLTQPLPPLALTNESIVAAWESALSQAADSKLKDFFTKQNRVIGEVSRPFLLSHFGPSLRGPALELAEMAANRHAEMIVAATTTKSAMDRFFLGSFVETLLLMSQIPVLTVNPQTRIPKVISRVYFPTDFSEESKNHFKKAIAISRRLGATLVLQHKFMIPADTMMEPGFAPASAVVTETESLLRNEMEDKDRIAKEWQKEAVETEVACEIQMLQGAESLMTSLLQGAQQREDSLMIASLQNHSGLSRVMGHVARSLVREARLPILILPATH